MPARRKKSVVKPAPKSTTRNYRDILYEVKDQVAWVTINRPRVLNAFREQTLDEMIDALKSTREDPSIVCAVVTGAGDKSFSAGGDFFAMKRLNFANAYMWNDRMLGLAMTIRGLPIPVIAMVNGWCMGGGHELALWCDLVIASENAVLGQTGAKVGACRCNSIYSAPHWRATGTRDDFLRTAVCGPGSGRGGPHQQVRAAERPAQRNAEVV
jgi:1,4-dihydroxy-2-naphthoyl-CoA synthase